MAGRRDGKKQRFRLVFLSFPFYDGASKFFCPPVDKLNAQMHKCMCVMKPTRVEELSHTQQVPGQQEVPPPTPPLPTELPGGSVHFPFFKKKTRKLGLAARTSHRCCSSVSLSLGVLPGELAGRDRGQPEHSAGLGYIRMCVSAGLVSPLRSLSLPTRLKKDD